MTVNYQFEQLDEKFPSDKLLELKRQITKSIPFLEKNLDRILEYLRKEDSLKNYIEINLPFLDLNISYKINLYSQKIIITVMNYNDSNIFGHLLIDGYDCLNKKEIKKLGLENIPKGKDRFEGIY